MAHFTIGTLTTVPVSSRPDLVSPSVFEQLRLLGLTDLVGVVEIDPELSDTAATQQAYGLDTGQLANCVIVAGKRDGVERVAACVVLASTRADVNGVVRRLLDVRKASFMGREQAVSTTAMEFGGITPVGLPHGWPVLVDSRVVESELVIIGSGIRRSKLVLPGELLEQLPLAEVVEGLGKLVAPTGPSGAPGAPGAPGSAEAVDTHGDGAGADNAGANASAVGADAPSGFAATALRVLAAAAGEAPPPTAEAAPQPVVPVHFESVAFDDPRAVELRRVMDADMALRYGPAGTTARDRAIQKALSVDPSSVEATILVMQGDAAVGHAVLRTLRGDWEVKRVIIDQALRGQGVGRALMVELERIARASGVRRLILQTGDKQPEAVALYTRLGYTPIAIYEPYIDAMPFSLCYEKHLD